MESGIGVILLASIPVLALGAGCLQLACRLSKSEVPSYAACIGWVMFMGGAANGGAAFVRNHVAPGLGSAAGLESTLMQAASYAIIPFVVLRLFVFEDTSAAVRVHVLNLLITGSVSIMAIGVFRQLS
jgi:hypothetical protein